MRDDYVELSMILTSDHCYLFSINVTHTTGSSACAVHGALPILVTDACQNRATNTLTYTWTADTTPPGISAPQGSAPLGCNPASIPGDAEVLALVRASDHSRRPSDLVTHVDGGTACASNRVFTIIVTDACQNRATNTRSDARRADKTPPGISAPQGTKQLGCNPASIPGDAEVLALVRASDNCGLLLTNVTHLDGGTACASNRLFTIIVTDACQNRATNTLTYTWTADTTPPGISAPRGTTPLGCNPASIPGGAEVLT